MQMQASRELDALVAENVLGGKLFTATPEQSANAGGSRVSHSTWLIMSDRDEGEWGPYVESIPQYSTSIAQAWNIVEIFRRGTYQNDMVACCVEMIISDVVVKDDCFCKIFSPVQPLAEAIGNTMPLAICRAALIAVSNDRF